MQQEAAANGSCGLIRAQVVRAELCASGQTLAWSFCRKGRQRGVPARTLGPPLAKCLLRRVQKGDPGEPREQAGRLVEPSGRSLVLDRSVARGSLRGGTAMHAARSQERSGWITSDTVRLG